MNLHYCGFPRLVEAILLSFTKIGWELLQSCDHTHVGDRDVMFFEYKQPDPDAQLFALNFHSLSNIR